MKVFDKLKSWYRGLPDKKRYVEFLTALLTIPVLITVIITNVGNLKSRQNEAPKSESVPQVTIVPIEVHTDGGSSKEQASDSATPIPTSAQCAPQVGPISIAYPDEGEVVAKDPVCIDVVRESTDYCSVAWSYRINDGAWSDYTDKSICLYGLPPGEKNLELRVKSIASSDEKLLKRTFTVEGTQLTPTPTSTESGTLQ